MSTSSLLFDGTIELCDPRHEVSQQNYWFDASATGAAWGDPQPVEVTLNSLMRDGAIVSTTGDANREASFLVKVHGTDSSALNAGVQALQAATRKRTTLTWTPPDGYCDPRVWDVETSNLVEPDGFDDQAYMLRNEQVFRLRLVCQPYRRWAVEVIDDAGSPPSSGDEVYAAASATGWSKWSTWPGLGGPDIGTDITVDTTTVPVGATSSIRAHCQTSGYGVTYLSNDQVTGLSINTDTGGYLLIPIRCTYGDNPEGDGLRSLWITTAEDGEAAVTDYLATARDENGYVTYVLQVEADLTITGARTLVNQTDVSGVGSAIPYVNYGPFQLADAASTDHQIVKQLTVLGSARGPGSLRVAAPSEAVALGHVLAITTPTGEVPAGFQPDGLRWITQGTPTVDASALHGNYYTPNTSTYDASAGKPIFDVPVAMFPSAIEKSAFTIVALALAESSTLTFGVQTQLLVDGAGVGPTSEAEFTPQGLTTGWQPVTIGTVYLPPLPIQNADDTTRVRLLFKGAKFSDVFFIPAWEVDGWPAADFSIVDCGTGTVEPGGASSSLWIDSPSTTQPRGGWWRGPTADRMNAQSAWPDAKKPGVHFFKAGPLMAWLVSTGAAGPTLTLRYFPREL